MKTLLLQALSGFSLFCVLGLPNVLSKGTTAHRISTVSSSLININNLAMWIHADGIAANNPYSADRTALAWGVTYPRGIPVGIVYSDGIIWGGIVRDGVEPLIRVGGCLYQSGLRQGAILLPGQAEDYTDPMVNRVWRYRRDWQTADLTDEAYDILVSLPGAADKNFQFGQNELQALADSLRDAYAFDLANWPWQKGAPFYDSNNNGIMDSGEEPGLLDCDQVAWLVANDLDPGHIKSLYGASPTGVEIQVTFWAKKDEPLANTIFRRVRLIYKGTSTTPQNAQIDSMAFGIFGDFDIGKLANDFGGTDTTRQMFYGYNSVNGDKAYQPYFSSVPALGYQLVVGPLVPGTALDIGTFDFTERPGFRNQPMFLSWIEGAGNATSLPIRGGDYNGTLQWWNVFRGYLPRPEQFPFPFRNPITGEPTTFLFTGDPISGTGWLDQGSGERYAVLTTGHFNMALGDTQEVIVALSAAVGATNLLSIAELRQTASLIQSSSFNNNFPQAPSASVLADFSDKTNTKLTIRAEAQQAEEIIAQLRDPAGGLAATLSLFEEAGEWFATWTTKPLQSGLSLDLQTVIGSDTLNWPSVLQNITTIGEVEAVRLMVVSDNINSDGKANPGENIRISAQLGNASLQTVNSVTIALETNDPWVKIEGNPQEVLTLPPQDTLAIGYNPQDPTTFITLQIAPGVPADHVVRFDITLYDKNYNLWQNEVSLRIEPFAAEPEAQLIGHIEGPASGTFGIYIIDPQALTGDGYRITINDGTSELADRTLNLINLTTGDTLLKNHLLPGEFAHNMPITDGFKLTRGTLNFDGGIDQFLETRFAGQLRNPPVPVWQQPSSDGSYALSETNRELLLGASILAGHDLELRFTPRGGYGWYKFQSNNPATVPFELWDTGVATPEDTTDDVRLIPILSTNGGSLDIFDIDSLSLDSFYNLPSSDRIYFYGGDYPAFENMARTGNVTDDVTGEFHIGPLLIVDLDQDGKLPPSETTIRITTIKPPTAFDVFEFMPIYTDVSDNSNLQLPKTFALYQNYPNPFNPTTTIRYDLSVKSEVAISVFNILGQEVLRLVDKAQPAGRYAVQWDGRNRAGVGVSSGVYFFKLKTDRFTRVNKMLLVR